MENNCLTIDLDGTTCFADGDVPIVDGDRQESLAWQDAYLRFKAVFECVVIKCVFMLSTPKSQASRAGLLPNGLLLCVPDALEYLTTCEHKTCHVLGWCIHTLCNQQPFLTPNRHVDRVIESISKFSSILFTFDAVSSQRQRGSSSLDYCNI